VQTTQQSKVFLEDVLHPILIYQALLAVFKSRLQDARESETSIERCDLVIQDQQDKKQCRLIIKMICRHGRHGASMFVLI
jgi:hypothetical protein